MRAWLLVVGLLLVIPGVGRGQDPNGPAQQDDEAWGDRMRSLQEKAMRLIEATQQLSNWDEHYAYIVDATERVFERNGWDSESDLFTLDMIREVDSIPPWAVQQRFDKALEMIGDRYLLDEDQMASLERYFTKVNVELFAEHSDRIMQYALEAVQTRAAGEPFTPEQIARWAKLAEPVFQDARRKVNETAKEFAQELDPEQRELFERDIAAANHRMVDIERMGQRWKRGEWDPHDWGLEQDPIQNPGAAAALAREAGDAGASPDGRAQRPERLPATAVEPQAPPVVQPEPPSSEPAPLVEPQGADDDWAKYVRAFIRKYQLNDEQQQRAWLYYRDSKGRDALFQKRFERQTERLRERGDAATNERTRDALSMQTEKRRLERERLFNQLKRRLERLPTRAQRKNAAPADSDASDSLAKKKAAREDEP